MPVRRGDVPVDAPVRLPPEQYLRLLLRDGRGRRIGQNAQEVCRYTRRECANNRGNARLCAAAGAASVRRAARRRRRPPPPPPAAVRVSTRRQRCARWPRARRSRPIRHTGSAATRGVSTRTKCAAARRCARRITRSSSALTLGGNSTTAARRAPGSGPAAGRPVQNSLEELDARSHTCFGNNSPNASLRKGVGPCTTTRRRLRRAHRRRRRRRCRPGRPSRERCAPPPLLASTSSAAHHPTHRTPLLAAGDPLPRPPHRVRQSRVGAPNPCDNNALQAEVVRILETERRALRVGASFKASDVSTTSRRHPGCRGRRQDLRGDRRRRGRGRGGADTRRARKADGDTGRGGQPPDRGGRGRGGAVGDDAGATGAAQPAAGARARRPPRRARSTARRPTRPRTPPAASPT